MGNEEAKGRGMTNPGGENKIKIGTCPEGKHEGRVWLVNGKCWECLEDESENGRRNRWSGEAYRYISPQKEDTGVSES